MTGVAIGKSLRVKFARACALSLVLILAPAVRGVAQSSSPSRSAQASQQREATIAIIPEMPRVCPGQSIGARYVERFPDGSQANLSPRDVKQFPRFDDETATMARDGSWQTNANVWRSILTGFRLQVSLARDSSVRGDTVVAPSYDCPRPIIQLVNSERVEAAAAYVRLGTFATPFYDSLVVAVVELEERTPTVVVLSPNEMRSNAIKIVAPGRNGAAGRSGRPGADGIDCSNGDIGEDGEPGAAGLPGREVDIIAQDGSPWLVNLVAVSNPGGRGGNGGAGGRGGQAGGVSAGTGRGARTCRSQQGRSGRDGPKGPDGPAGASKVTSVLAQLLWPGSPIWSDPTAKRALEGLMAYERK